jgi:hypothetical protein
MQVWDLQHAMDRPVKVHACMQVWDLQRAMDRPVRVQRATSWAEKARLTCALFAADARAPALLVGCSNGKVGVWRHAGLASGAPEEAQRAALAALVQGGAAA